MHRPAPRPAHDALGPPVGPGLICGVSTVYVLGGSAAVADSVVTAVEGLNSKPTVTRIAGDDRYATAAAIASMIDAESSWCGTDAVSAVLINGATEAMPFGVAVQTIAYRLQLPVLMTAFRPRSAITSLRRPRPSAATS